MSRHRGRSCPSCRQSMLYWLDYFCDRCGEHYDQLYCSEATDTRPRSREEIAEEYLAAGMTDEARRLQAAPVVLIPDPNGSPAPATVPTAFVQRSLLELLESA